MSARLQNTCRTCLSENEQQRFFQLYDYIEEVDHKIILEMLDETIPQLKIRDENRFSQLLCQECMDKLLASYRFQQLCIATNNKLLATCLNNEGNEIHLGNGVNPLTLEEQQYITIKPDMDSMLPEENKTILGKELNPLIANEEQYTITIKSEMDSIMLSNADYCGETVLTEELDIKVETEFIDEYDDGVDKCYDPKSSPNPQKSETSRSKDKSIIACNICGKTFTKRYSLRRHAIVHDQNRGFPCKICTYVFKTEKMCNSHMATTHKVVIIKDGNIEIVGKENHFCIDNTNRERNDSDDDKESIKEDVTEKSELEKSDMGEIERPRRAQKPPKDGLPCNVCGKFFSDRKRLERHMPYHSMERQYACDICKYRFSTSGLLRQHIPRHANGGDGTLVFKCPDCPRRFEKKASLSSHRRHTHTANTTTKTVKQHLDDFLKKHSESAPSKDNQQFICTICQKQLSSKYTLTQHILMHRDEKPHVCNQCGKRFTAPHTLKDHMERHTVKKYQCTKCPLRFKIISDLKKHHITHENIRPYVCDLCGSKFTKSCSLRRHKMRHSGEKTHLCDHCGMGFLTAHHLSRHVRTHTGEKPYKCKYCDRAYAQSNDLNKHLRTHVGENTYMCKECPQAFKYLAELQHHIWEEHCKKSLEPQQKEEVDNDTVHRQQQELSNVTSEESHIEVESQELHHSPGIKNYKNKMPAEHNNKCRTCLNENMQQKFFQLYDCIEEQEHKIILEMLDETIPQLKIREENRFSQLICQECLDKLLASYRFQQLCIATNNKLLATCPNKEENEVLDERELDPLTEEPCSKIKQDLDDNSECKIVPEELNFKFEMEWSEDDNEGSRCDSDSRTPRNDKSKSSKSKSQMPQSKRESVPTCSVCGKTFSRLFNLHRHAKVHDQNRAYPCDICTYKCDSEKAYRTHMMSRHKGENPNSNHKKKNGTNEKSVEHDDTKQEKEEENPTNLAESLVEMQEISITDGDVKEHESLESDDQEEDANWNPSDSEDDEDEIEENVSNAKYNADPDFVDTGIGEIERPRQKRSKANFPCSACDKIFNSPYNLKRHMPFHSMERQHVCEICKYRFRTLWLLRQHMAKHENDGVSSPPQAFQCPDCPRRFERKTSLSIHRKHMHMVGSNATESIHPCTACQRSFMSIRSLTEHIKTKHPEIEPHKCSQCDKTFVVHAHLLEHLNRHKGSKKVVCTICEKELSHKHSLKEHMRIHTGESPYLCPQCGKAFKVPGKLKEHMERHFGLKKYQCPECPSRFNCRSDVKKHAFSHRNAKPYVCDICGSSYTKGSTLKKHKMKHTGEKPHVCDQCGMGFVSTDHLRRHIRTHTGEKPYKCKFCDNAYAQSGDLNKHLRIHVGENTYMCNQCPQAFKYHNELRQHVAEHYKATHQQDGEESEDQQQHEQREEVETVERQKQQEEFAQDQHHHAKLFQRQLLNNIFLSQQ
ncbi:uncharacterized protein [Musca autumnalis]|uniref:uncharacterized protein n=1 Tax=Musca autumnalis TaxID=221902 RepID=UPI003CE9ED45